MHIFFHGCCFGSGLCFWDLFTLFNKCATLLHLSSLLPSIVLCKYTNFFCSTVDVHIDCFLLFAIINNVVNIPVCVFSRTFSKVFLSIYQWNDLPSCKVFSISVSLENNKLFTHKWVWMIISVFEAVWQWKLSCIFNKIILTKNNRNHSHSQKWYC